MCVVMVSSLRVTEGVLLFGKESLLLCEEFTLSPAGDVCCRKHHPSRYGYVCCTDACSYTKTIASQPVIFCPLCPFLSLPV